MFNTAAMLSFNAICLCLTFLACAVPWHLALQCCAAAALGRAAFLNYDYVASNDVGVALSALLFMMEPSISDYWCCATLACSI